MRGLRCRIANRLWYLSCLREARAFHRGLDAVAATQERLLLEMLRANRFTTFGQEHGFARIGSVREYQQALPLRDYQDFVPLIERIRRGETNVLTAEPVLLLEPTGGSSGGSKLIPYTAGIKRQFQRGIAPWIADLFRNHPGLLNGESYWSVTPVVTRAAVEQGTVPIGFEDDSEYVGGLGKWLVRAVQAVPEELKQVSDMESFWYLTLLLLLRSRDLTLISIWNPTFLTILDQHLQRWWLRLADDIASGGLTLPLPLEPALAEKLRRQHRPDSRRGAEIRRACVAGASRAEVYRLLWPHLRLLSCWQDGAAAALAPAQELGRLFPEVTVQGKGLIATEGFFTLPLSGVTGCLPAIRSHFLEFLPEDGGGIRLLHELEADRTYSLVVTTAGGLYRYRMHDLVRVTGFFRGAPLLRFVGKEGHISDRFGEKLHEEHVRTVLDRTATRIRLNTKFSLLAFEGQPTPGYVYFVEDGPSTDEQLLQAAALIDELLKENFHYRYCRDLGQLAAVQVFRIDGDGQLCYIKACCQRGQRLGDVKPLALQRVSGWCEIFAGRRLAAGSGLAAFGRECCRPDRHCQS